MKLSLNWLKHYIEHGLTAEELSFRMTMAGLEVEHQETVNGDTVFEIEITPNRPDCLNMLGLAREVSAITDKELCLPAVNGYADLPGIDIAIDDKEACRRYIGTLIEGVAVWEFPADKAMLLQSIGVKTISNVVDITNFVLFEYGQPLHAFDADKLAGGKLVVRRAKKGEKLVTLDDVERVLDESILVIADAEKPVAIAGIMGGKATGVTSATKRIILESAYFDMGLVRRASRKLGLGSDSSYRFERGVDMGGVLIASDRATNMILALAGGKVAARRDTGAGITAAVRPAIAVSSEEIKKLLGTTIDMARAKRILERLGCAVTVAGDAVTVVPPENRHDLKIKEDIIEEVGRVIGFDNLPMTLPRVGALNIPVDLEHEGFNRAVAERFVAQGFNEILTYAMISRAALEKAGYDGVKPVVLQNPMSAEQELMRPAVLANMLLVVASNMNRGQRDLCLFEVGKRYLPAGERWTLGVIMTGRRANDWRRGKREAMDFFDIKGAVETALGCQRVAGLKLMTGTDAGLEPGQTARVMIGDQEAGRMGKVAEQVLLNFEIKKADVYFAEIDLEYARDAVMPRLKFEAPDEYPSVVRDVSLAVKDVVFEDLRALCLTNGQGLLRKVELVEEYRGDKIEAGFKGLVVSLTYQAKDRTLTE
ncbi:MAG: phenylalanine--tRNA ligase subunit beta, partial [Candidatus Omnitrophota bacterium]